MARLEQVSPTRNQPRRSNDEFERGVQFIQSIFLTFALMVIYTVLNAAMHVQFHRNQALTEPQVLFELANKAVLAAPALFLLIRYTTPLLKAKTMHVVLFLVSLYSGCRHLSMVLQNEKWD